ncbi:MAG: DnaA ATPase domain-containing protein [Nitrospinota bacterium]
MKQRQLSFGLKLPEKELYSLNRFCPSAQNRIALKAAAAFGNGPGLFSLTIMGGRKTGKSHLLKGIALNQKPRKNAAYVSCEMLASSSPGKMRRAMMSLRKYKTVCVDDLELGQKSRIFYDELFHLYNHLADRGGRLAISMSRSPAAAHFLPKYLSTRLLSGMVVKLKKPDEKLRAAILKKLAADSNIELTAGALRYILERSHRSVEKLMEFVSRLDVSLEHRSKRIGLQPIRRMLISE